MLGGRDNVLFNLNLAENIFHILFNVALATSQQNLFYYMIWNGTYDDNIFIIICLIIVEDLTLSLEYLYKGIIEPGSTAL